MSIDTMTAAFRERLTAKGTIDVLGQTPQRGPGMPGLHANSVAAYRIGYHEGSKITPAQYDAVIDVIDAVKMDDKPLDSDGYASAILVALGVSL